jgi:hypothetical protein
MRFLRSDLLGGLVAASVILAVGLWVAWRRPDAAPRAGPGPTVYPGLPDPEPPKPADVRFGLTLEQRKQAFWDSATEDNRAEEEGDKKFNVDTRSLLTMTPEQTERYNRVKRDRWEHVERVAEQYHRQVAERYGITTDQLFEIVAEGGEKHWPFPRR